MGHFLKDVVESIVEKMGKHVLLSNKVIATHMSVLQEHGTFHPILSFPFVLKRGLLMFLVVDAESSTFMDQTSEFLNKYNTQFTDDIERRAKEVKVEVYPPAPLNRWDSGIVLIGVRMLRRMGLLGHLGM